MLGEPECSRVLVSLWNKGLGIAQVRLASLGARYPVERGRPAKPDDAVAWSQGGWGAGLQPRQDHTLTTGPELATARIGWAMGLG